MAPAPEHKVIESKKQNLSSSMLINAPTFDTCTSEHASPTNGTNYLFEDDSVDLFKDESHFNMSLDWADVHQWLSENNQGNVTLEHSKQSEASSLNVSETLRTRSSSRRRFETSGTNSILDISAISYIDDEVETVDISVSLRHSFTDGDGSLTLNQGEDLRDIKSTSRDVAEMIYDAAFGWNFCRPDECNACLVLTDDTNKGKNDCVESVEYSTKPSLCTTATNSSNESSQILTDSLFNVSDAKTHHEIPERNQKSGWLSRCLCFQ
mmetsp:Transcript_14618/g.20666  ORF Transcript_14618/g.20666 Transcript_14618/m.20666 type:complete len:266 (+) Transcript_14618:80-877(+)